MNVQAVNLDIIFADAMAEIICLGTAASIRFIVDDLSPLAWLGFRLTRPEEFFRHG